MSPFVAGLQIERHLARLVLLDVGAEPRVVDVAEIDLPVTSSNVERVERLASLWDALSLRGVPAVVVSLGSVTFAQEEARRAGVDVVDAVAAGPFAASRAMVPGSAGIVVLDDRGELVAVVVGGPGGQLPAPAASLASGPVPGFVPVGASTAGTAPAWTPGRSSGADLLRLVGEPRWPVPLCHAGAGLAADSPTPDPVAVLAFGAALLAHDRVVGRVGTAPVEAASPATAEARVASLAPLDDAPAPATTSSSPTPVPSWTAPVTTGPVETRPPAAEGPPVSPTPTASVLWTTPTPPRPRQASRPEPGPGTDSAQRDGGSSLGAVLSGAAKGVVAGLVAVAVFASPLGDRTPFVPEPEPTTATSTSIVATASTLGQAGAFSPDCRDVGAVVLTLGKVDVPLDTTVLFEGTSAVLTAAGRKCAADVATVLSFAPTRTLQLVSDETARVESFGQAVRNVGIEAARVEVVASPPGAAGLLLRFTDG